MTKLQERLRALIGDLAPRNHVPLATEAADALDAAEAEIARLKDERDRIERNRDMWKGQCERQAEQLSRTQLPAVAEDVVERIKKIALGGFIEKQMNAGRETLPTNEIEPVREAIEDAVGMLLNILRTDKEPV